VVWAGPGQPLPQIQWKLYHEPPLEAIVEVRIFKPGEATPVRTIVTSGLADGQTQNTVTWDGRGDVPAGAPPGVQGALQPVGVYAYEIWARHEPTGGYYCQDQKCSGERTSGGFLTSYLRIEPPVDPPTGQPNFRIDYEAYDEPNARQLFDLTYVLKETKGLPASAGQIQVYDPELVLIHSQALLPADLTASPLGVAHTVRVEVPAHLMQKPGTYQFLVSAMDSEANEYRDADPGLHQNRPALESQQAIDWIIDLDADVNGDGTVGDEEDEGLEEIVGLYLARNDDDDNANGVADEAETGPVTGEDDLVKIVLQDAPGCRRGGCCGRWKLRQPS